MIKYAVVEIKGRQYKVEPNKTLQVNFLGDLKTLNCDRVLLKAESDKVEYGDPFLKETLVFDVLGQKKEKIRVAKYHAKANTRKVVGGVSLVSFIKLSQKREKQAQN